jgi:hypothetical protein
VECSTPTTTTTQAATTTTTQAGTTTTTTQAGTTTTTTQAGTTTTTTQAGTTTTTTTAPTCTFDGNYADVSIYEDPCGQSAGSSTTTLYQDNFGTYYTNSSCDITATGKYAAPNQTITSYLDCFGGFCSTVNC